MPTDWKTVAWGAGLGTILTIAVLNFMPSVAPYVEKPKTAKPN